MTLSLKDELDEHKSSFNGWEMNPDDYYLKLAEKTMEKAEQFEPIKENPLELIVYVENLPKVTPEKFKTLLQKIVVSMVKPIASIKKNQIILNPVGFSCMIRFSTASEAKEFVSTYDGSTDVFGFKYPLIVRSYTEIEKELNAEEPKLREAKTVNLIDTFTHLQQQQVVSRFILKNTEDYYFCSYNNCLGLQKELNSELMSDFHFSSQGTFIVEEFSGKIVLSTNAEKFEFPIEKKKFEHFAFKISNCEKFVAFLYAKKENDKLLYKTEVFSIFENYKIYSSDILEAYQTVPLEDEIDFSATGRFAYILNKQEEEIMIFETEHETEEIYHFRKLYSINSEELKQIQFSPVQQLLAVYLEKQNSPSEFMLIDPNLQELNCKVFTRSINVTSGQFLFENSGDYVTIKAETKVKKEISTMVVLVKICKNYPVKTIKLSEKKHLSALEVFQQKIFFCVDGGLYKVDENGEEVKITDLSCNKLYFSNLTNVLLCIHEEKGKENMKETKVVFIDYEKSIPLMAFDGEFYAVEIDEYGRYLICLSADKLEIYSLSSELVFEENCQYEKLIIRPEETEEVSPSEELIEKAKKNLSTYLEDYVQMENTAIKERNINESQKEKKCLQQFEKAFNSENERSEERRIKEERIRRIQKGYPDYCNAELEEIQLQMDLKIGGPEHSRISLDQYQMIIEREKK